MPTIKLNLEARVGGWIIFWRISPRPEPFEAFSNAVVIDAQKGGA